MSKLTRSSKITYEVIEGADILVQGHEMARHLWNQLWYHQIGHNEKLAKKRQGTIGYYSKKKKAWRYDIRLDWEVIKPNLPHNRGEKYPGWQTISKEMKDHWSAKSLSDRCSSYTIRDFDIAMRSWFSNLKKNPLARPPKYSNNPRILNFEIGRNAKPVGEWTYRLTILGGHIKERYAIVRLRIKPGIKMKDVKLIRLQANGSGVVTTSKDLPKESSGQGIAAIDLGIRNIATVAFSNGESIMISGRAIKASNQWYQKRAAKCKPSKWKKGMKQETQSKRNAQYRKKAGNIHRLATHNVTRFIINECLKRKVWIIVTGDLKGIRDNANHGRGGNQHLHAWPFAEIKRQLEYKAEEIGIEVVSVSERNTSKCCHICNQKGRRSPHGLFTCKGCGIVINSDVNGAFGIINRLYPYFERRIIEIVKKLDKARKSLTIETDPKKVERLRKKIDNLITTLEKLAKDKEKVSPSPIYVGRGAGVGVEAAFPGLPSPSFGDEISLQRPRVKGTLKVQSTNGQFSQIPPTFVAKFDLRNWSIVQTRCN